MLVDVIEKSVAELSKEDLEQGFYLCDPRSKVLSKMTNHTAFLLLKLGTECIFLKKGNNVYYLDYY